MNALHFVDGTNGSVLASAGSDSQLRTWDMKTLSAQFTNFSNVSNRQSRPTTMASVSTGPLNEALLFHPNADGTVVVLHSQSGDVHSTLRGHYACVNACAIRHSTQQLVSCSDDATVLLWSPRFPRRAPILPAKPGDDDSWQDDWEDAK